MFIVSPDNTDGTMIQDLLYSFLKAVTESDTDTNSENDDMDK